jgi:6-phosphogluconolactonase (cycloisomerase 2 family)
MLTARPAIGGLRPRIGGLAPQRAGRIVACAVAALISMVSCASASAALNLTGTWSANYHCEVGCAGANYPATDTLTQTEGSEVVTGTNGTETITGTLTGNTFTFQSTNGVYKAEATLTVSVDGLSWSGPAHDNNGTSGTYTATRGTGSLRQLESPFNCVSVLVNGLSCGTLIPSGLERIRGIAISPDARNVYAADHLKGGSGALIEFSRNQATGALTEIGCVTGGTTVCSSENDVSEAKAMNAPEIVKVSPNGANVYVTTTLENALVTFSRNPETGLLTETGCIVHAALAGCTGGVHGLEGPGEITVSPDEKNVYVTSFFESAVAEFARNTTTGELSPLASPNECISSDAKSKCGTVTAAGLEQASSLAVSPDGANVYVAAVGESGGDVAELERNPAEGALKQLGGANACLTTETVAGCSHVIDMYGPGEIIVSPDGHNVYANSFNFNAVLEFSREPSGELTQLAAPNTCVSSEATTPEHCKSAKGIQGPFGIAISPDGSNLYATGEFSNAIAAFTRNPSTGELIQLEEPYECITESASGCSTRKAVGLRTAFLAVVSPDGTNVYVAGEKESSISEFARAVTPAVTGVNPNSGSEAGGTEVEITGSGFIEGATVTFGASPASHVRVNSAGSITATSPAGVGTVEVTVTTSSGTSEKSALHHFKYVYVPPKQLGGMNVAGYCVSLGDTGNGGGPTTFLRGAVEGPEYAYKNWACVKDDGTDVEIAPTGPAPSMSDLCHVQYPGAASYAYPDDPNNAFTWSCYESLPPEESKGGGGGVSTAKASSLVTPIVSAPPLVVPPPVLAHTGNVAPVAGKVLVRVPGTSKFVPLSALQQIPFGSVIDARNGTVSVTTALPGGGTQTGQFFSGEFILRQGPNGLVVAELTGGNFSVCPTARERSHIARAGSVNAHAAASGKHVVRKLWANAHGKFSTKGNYAAGAVQGTEWLTEDLCDGTLIKVTRDRVAVTNLVNHRHKTVKAGHSYLAKAP